MKKQLGIIAIMSLLMISLVCAAGTFNTPTSSGTIEASYVFNVTSTLTNLVNCTVTGTSGSTGDSLSGLLLKNETGGDTTVNGTLVTNALLDANDWTFTGTCYNDSGSSETITAITSVIVDNTVPSCTFDSSLTSKEEYSTTQQWQVTGYNATAASIYFGSNAGLVMAESSDVFTYTGNKNDVPEGTYNTLTVITSDGTNSTSCSLQYITIDSGATAKKVAAMVMSGQVKKTGSAGDNNLIVPLILVVAGIYWYKKKK